jgi:hypothetical protein
MPQALSVNEGNVGPDRGVRRTEDAKGRRFERTPAVPGGVTTHCVRRRAPLHCSDRHTSGNVGRGAGVTWHFQRSPRGHWRRWRVLLMPAPANAPQGIKWIRQPSREEPDRGPEPRTPIGQQAREMASADGAGQWRPDRSRRPGVRFRTGTPGRDVRMEFRRAVLRVPNCRVPG